MDQEIVNISHEKALLGALVDCLNSSEGFISASLLRCFEQFYLEKISISELITNIGTVKDLFIKDKILALQNTASNVNPNISLQLQNEFNAVLSSYLKPVKISKQIIEGRSIIEITGTYIVVSECLKSIEQNLQAEEAKGLEVHEVHFVGALVVHIDTDLDNKTWQGRNIKVCTKKIKVHDSVTWNVSGKNANHIYSTKAGTNDEGDGIRGKDGYPGGNGGNVLVVTDEIENAKSFKIISNGGNGSNGQDGGDGRDGLNGTGITRKQMLDQFFFSGNYIGVEQNRKIFKLISNIQTVARTIDTAWINGRNISWEELLRWNEDRILNDIFIEAKTDVGNEIVFSMHRTISSTVNPFLYVSPMHNRAIETIFLYKGINGTAGRIGGAYGLGGQGGFPGKISIESISISENQFVINTEAVAGTNGEPGKRGVDGKSGNNGWDMGYLESRKERSTQFYGTSLNEKLRLVRFDDSTSISAWSKHYSAFIGFRLIKNKSEKQITQPTNTSSICAINRQRQFGNNIPNVNLIKNSWVMNDWIQIKNIQLGALETNVLFETILATPVLKKIFKNTEDFQAITNILCEKYRLVTLNKIAESLPMYLNIPEDIKIPAESAAKFLIQEDNPSCATYHSMIITLKQFLWDEGSDKRKEVFQYCTDSKESNDKQLWRTLVKTFIVEKAANNVNYSYDKYSFDEQECTQQLIVPSESTDPSFMKELKEFFLQKGPLSKSYRLLLANMLNVNIRTYIKVDDEKDENKYTLNDEYKPEADQVIHLLLTEDGLLELSINKDHLKMKVERRLKSQMFIKILTEVEPLREKRQLDAYYHKLPDLDQGMNNLTRGEHYEVETRQLSHEANEYTGLYQMDYLKEIIQYFPDEREKLKLAQTFREISKLRGHQYLLNNIQRRFACEGRHVSYEEISCLINAPLSTVNDREEHLNIVSWIAAAYSQQNWIDELLLMKVESYLKVQIEDKMKWRDYLAKIENKKLLVLLHEKLDSLNSRSSITHQCFAIIFYLLSKIHRLSCSMESVDINEWPYVLRDNYWISKLCKLIGSHASDFADHLYYLLSIENTYGTELTENLIEALEKVKLEETFLSAKLKHILCNFHDEKWTLNAHVIQLISRTIIDLWIDDMDNASKSDGKNRNAKELIELIENNGNTSTNIVHYLHTLSKSISEPSEIGATALTREDIKTSANSIRDAIRDKKRTISDCLDEILNVIDKGIQFQCGYPLRDSQKLAILSLMTNPRKTLAQVSTGEGKSLIVVAAAIINALQGKKVHIMTSSPVLAKRDAEENAKIFNLFGVSVSHNCSLFIKDRREAYSNHQVIYGTLRKFQSDYLSNRLYGKQLLDDHDLESVIIDEVDSMLLDKTTGLIYLSHDLSGFDKLEPLYIFIWQWINSPTTKSKDTSAIKEAVLDEMYARVHKSEIEQLHTVLNKEHKLTIWARLIETNIINERGIILMESITEKDIDGIVPSNVECSSSVRNRLRYILNESIDRLRSIDIPNYLKPFVEQHLESWIRSAVQAFYKKSGDSYVVDLVNRNSNQSNNMNIIIIDRNTGTDRPNTTWDEAHHQFLELKHSCKLSLQDLKAVFISNVSFLKTYEDLRGLTGTLGAKRERDLLQEIYDVDYVIIPTAKAKQFHEEKSIVCTTSEDWKNQILHEVKQIINEQKRSILIICETINMVNDLYQLFGGRKETHVHTYTRDYEEFEVAKDGHRLHTGQIIIATNLAGRGTDIKIGDELSQAGGLHVLLTYLPSNIRIEQQAFGRAARCGEEGSGRLIILNSSGQESASTKIFKLKRNRHTQELNRLAKIKVSCDVHISAEEECFKKFRVEYGRLKTELTDKQVPNELQDVLMGSCIDKWAYWLDENSKWIYTSHHSLGKMKYQTSLNNFLREMKGFSTGATECYILDKANPKKFLKKFKYNSTIWIKWVKDNPPRMVELGKYLSQNLKEFDNAHDSALELFDNVIREEPNFSEVARYYKASLLIKQAERGDRSTIKAVKTELRLAAKLFEKRIEQHFKAISIIGYIQKNNTGNVIQVNTFENQQRHLMELYNEFITSINNMLGHSVSPDCFVSKIPSIDTQMANAIFAELVHNDVVKPSMLAKQFSEKDFKEICHEYGVSVPLLQNTIKEWGEMRIHEKDFMTHLEKRILLSNRRQFWTMLKEKKVLCDNKQYVAIQKNRLEEMDSYLTKLLVKNVKKQHKEDILNIGGVQQVLYVDWTELEKDNELIFENEYFRALVGPKTYEEWNELEVLSFNEKASINRSHIENIRFDVFDSIRPGDFANVGIVLTEAVEIIAELVKQNILVKEPAPKDNVYLLKGSLDEISDEQLTFFAGYKQIVKQLLSCSFAYRIAFNKMVKALQKGISNIVLDLNVDPHQDLLMDLLEQSIIVRPCVNSNVKDLDKKVERICKNSSWMLLNDPKIIQYTINALNNLKMPNISLATLKPLPETSERNEERKIFAIIGLDCVLQCEEKKWTNTMLFNTLCVSCIGIGQMALGIMTLPSVGFSFVAEGVHDLIFAIRAMQTGFFSWTNYLNQKWKSIIETVCITAFSYAANQCFKVLRYGMKVSKPLFLVKVSSVLQGLQNKMPIMKKTISLTPRILMLVPKKYRSVKTIGASYLVINKTMKGLRGIYQATKYPMIKQTVDFKKNCHKGSFKQTKTQTLMEEPLPFNPDIVKEDRSVQRPKQSKSNNPNAPKNPKKTNPRKKTNIICSSEHFPGIPVGVMFDGDDHFFARFRLTLYAMGVINSAFSENPSLDYIVRGGPSQTQDQSSGVGRRADAAHLIRIGEINPDIETDRHLIVLINMSSATQRVNPWFNRSRVARQIDELQSNWLARTDRMVVNGRFTSSAAETLENFRLKFIQILKDAIEYDPAHAEVYRRTIFRIEQLPLEAMKNMVRDGYEFGPITQTFWVSKNVKNKEKKPKIKQEEPENEE